MNETSPHHYLMVDHSTAGKKIEFFKGYGAVLHHALNCASSRNVRSSVFPFILIALLFFSILPNQISQASNLRGPTGLIRVGIFPFEPFNYIDENGVAQGFNPDLLRMIVHEEAWSVEFVPVNWSEGLSRLQTGEIDLMMSVGYSQERSKVMDYNFESVAELWGQVFHRHDRKTLNIDDLAGQTVAVMKRDINGSNFIKTAELHGIKCTIKEFATHDDVFAAVRKGEVLAGVAPYHFGLGHAHEHGLAASSIMFSPFPIYFATKKGMHHELLSHIDSHLSEWKRDENSYYYQRLNYWLGSQVSKPILPNWIIYTLSASAAVVLFFTGFTFLLNQTVRVRTRKLRESETRYKELTLLTSDVVWEIDAQGTYLYCSEQVQDILGYTQEELVGKPIFGFMPEEWARAAERFLVEQRSNRGPFYHHETWNIHKDGTHVCLSSSGIPILNGDGTLQGYRGTATNITDKKAAEQAVEDNQRRLQAIVEIVSKQGFTERELAGFALEKGVDLTRSQAGYFHFYNEDAQTIERTCWSELAFKECRAAAPEHHPLQTAGLWAGCVRTRKPAIHNDYQSEFDAKQLPEEHFNIGRHMSVPVIIDDRIIAIAGVWNKQSPYTANDCHQLILLLTDALHIIEKRKTERALAESEKRLRHITEATHEGYALSTDEVLIDSNTQFAEMFGYLPHELIGVDIKNLFAPESIELIQKNIRTNFREPYEAIAVKKNGERFPISLQGRDLLYQGQSVRESIVRDLTAQREMEAKLRQSYKMEVIGTLAGGIAHDFNNLLSIIIGYTEMAYEDIPEDVECRKKLGQALGAAAKARDLVSQILAFSRQSDVEKMPLNPSPLIIQWLSMLRSSLPTTISIEQNIDSDCGIILADATQLQQIFMNLCTNAFHAMEASGGILTVSLNPYKPPITGHLLPTIAPGGIDYIELCVADNGKGINPATLKRIFDPYFTTKEKGKGTGMGLAIVHAIIEDYGGMIHVDSVEGVGTTFQVLLPTIEAAVSPQRKQSGKAFGGNERILFVDDEPGLVEIGNKILGKLGYEVTSFTDSYQALEFFRKNHQEIDLVITDQTMPGMTGAELAKALLQTNKNLPIILCTGFSSIMSEEKARSIGIREFAIKPLKKNDIAQLIRRVLDDIDSQA